jgi:sodium-dependent dicarboxylate transporter 2/3/5
LDLYFWHRLPIILLFLNGYIAYRLIVVTNLTTLIVAWVLHRSRGSLRRLIWYVIWATVLLSAFIPNAVAVLALLPILRRIVSQLDTAQTRYTATTALALAAIYGANIGGLGSLIGSPSNLLLIAALDYFKVAGAEKITFANWFIWSAPLVACLALLAWSLINMVGLVGLSPPAASKLHTSYRKRKLDKDQKRAVIFLSSSFGFWLLSGVLRNLYPPWAEVEILVSALFVSVFLLLLMVAPAKHKPGPLLPWASLLADFPRRGVVFLAIIVLIIAMVKLTGLGTGLKTAAIALLPAGISSLELLLVFVLTTIFLTEMLSNTVVATAFFAAAYLFASLNDIAPLPVMIGVSAASTCAFMTPVATPSNALVYGEMAGTSLKRMFATGLLMNIGTTLMIAYWIGWIIPRIYASP